jgi:hypothetical protein
MSGMSHSFTGNGVWPGNYLIRQTFTAIVLEAVQYALKVWFHRGYRGRQYVT